MSEKIAVPADAVERLRKSKADRDEARRIADEQRRLEEENERIEGRQAGRAWAIDDAEFDQLESLKTINQSDHPQKSLVLSRFGPPGSLNFRRGFVEGAIEVWEEVKDQF